jgi:hypothetical protein
VREFLANKEITALEHPPYSQDLAPSDFFLFPKIMEILKGRHFDDIDDIRSNTTPVLGTGSYIPGVKRPERETDHSTISTEVKNGGAIPLGFPYIFME